MNEDLLAYQSLFGADLKKLPIGVLKAIRAAVAEEIKGRNQQNSVVRDQERDIVNGAVKRFKGLSKPHHAFTHHLFGYLNELLSQDWSGLFSDGDTERRYYVYLHTTPNTKNLRFVHPQCNIHTRGLPFYVGKGTGGRAYDLKRNDGHGSILRGLKESGYTANEIVCIVKSGLSEKEALELESKLIYFFGTRYEKGRKGLLVNLEIPPKPDFSG